ncbi:protective antigen [Enterococcus pernyi]
MKQNLLKALFLLAILLVISPQVNAQESVTSEVQKQMQYGLMGYYFEDNKFQNAILVGPTYQDTLAFNKQDTKNLITDSQKFSSFRWIGELRSLENQNYHSFKLTGITNYKIEIDGEPIDVKDELKLKKDQRIKLKVEGISDTPLSITDIEEIKLVAQSSNGNEHFFDNQELNTPDTRSDEWKKIISSAGNYNLFRLKNNMPLLDTDGDHIFDEWEINGYTIQNRIIVPWKDEYEQSGYKKFVSNPFEAHTAGDPYTDYEKAAKDMPLANSEEVFNPLVAAFPAVNVNLENIILSSNQDLTNSVSSNHSTNWTYSNTEGVDVTAGWQGLGPNFGVTGHYTHSNTVANEWGGSNDDTTHINSAESAFLNANVRYNNVGTGAIYEVKPTVSFVLNNDTLGTIRAKDNTTALAILPNESYPRKGQNGIAINTMDDFNSRPIPLNKNQLATFISNESPILLETNQVDGRYMIKDSTGSIRLGGFWNGVEQQIKKRTASVIIDDGESVVERRIAAKDPSDPEDRTPELTLKEALKIGFKDIREQDGKLLYKNKSIEEYHSVAFLDEFTAQRVRHQLSDSQGAYRDVSDLYEIIIEPEMAITLKQPKFYDDARLETSPLGRMSNVVSHKTTDDLGNMGGVYYAQTTRPNLDTARLDFNNDVLQNLNPNSKYSITFSVKADSRYPTSTVTLRTLGRFGTMNGPNQRYNISPDGYQRISVIYDPGIYGGGENTILNTLELVIFSTPSTFDTQGVYFKDISITEIGTWSP